MPISRVLFFCFLFLVCLFGQGVPVFALPQETTARHAYIIDFETGQVLLNKEGTTKMPTSSMSKVMTMYMVFDALKSGKISMDTKFRVSEKAWRMGGSKMFVELGKEIKLEDLIRGVIVQSGNDATIVLAEGVSGSEDIFARQMTEKATAIGMSDSNFANASGWPDPNHYSTAKDLARLGMRMISDFPDYYKFYSETEFTYNAIKQQNRNPLLYLNIGADGIKTGHTDVGGYGLIGSAQKDGRRVVMVLNGLANESDRAKEAERLILWALNNFENKTILTKGQKLADLPVTMGETQTVATIVADDIRLTLPKTGRGDIRFDVRYNQPLVAPIQKGQQIAVLEISIPDQGAFEVPLYAADEVIPLGFFARGWRRMTHSFIELF